MIGLRFGEFEVRLESVASYSFDSTDNGQHFDRSYRLDDQPCLPSSMLAVRVIALDGQHQVASCILAAAGGASGFRENSVVLHDHTLIVAVGPCVASFNLPTLEMNWKLQTDAAVCFGIYHLPTERCYISHGEINVARVSYRGDVEWSRSGADILTNGFSITEHQIEVIDWNNDVYVWEISTGKLSSAATGKRTLRSDI